MTLSKRRRARAVIETGSRSHRTQSDDHQIEPGGTPASLSAPFSLFYSDTGTLTVREQNPAAVNVDIVITPVIKSQKSGNEFEGLVYKFGVI